MRRPRRERNGLPPTTPRKAMHNHGIALTVAIVTVPVAGGATLAAPLIGAISARRRQTRSLKAENQRLRLQLARALSMRDVQELEPLSTRRRNSPELPPWESQLSEGWPRTGGGGAHGNAETVSALARVNQAS